MSAAFESELQTHGKSLRRLAQALVGSDDADDLLQDAMVAALQQPEPPRTPMAWLAGVLRNLAGKHHRAARRRVQREQRAVQRDTLPPADHAAEVGDSMRRLTDAVLALPQPYREVVLLRYMRELSPPAIAARLGVPLATVRSQLQRGLALLRQRVADGAQDWRSALGAAFGIDRVSPIAAAGTVATTGALLMGTGFKVVAAALATGLLVTGFAYWPMLWDEANAPAQPPSTAALAAQGPSDAAAESRTGNQDLVRRAVPPRNATEVDAPVLAAELAKLRSLKGAKLYAGVATWFVRDAEFAEQLARALLADLLTRSGSSFEGEAPVLAAWLHATGKADAIVHAALEVLEGIGARTAAHPAEESSFCFKLALALGSLVDPERYPASHPTTRSAETRQSILDALIQEANAGTLSTRTAAAVAMALQHARAGDMRVIQVLASIARSRLPYMARGSAITALGNLVTPAEIVAYCGRAPRVAISEEEGLEEASVFGALLTATTRNGTDRRVLQEWARSRLRLPGSTSYQEQMQDSLLGQLEVADLRALRSALVEVEASSPSERVRRAAQRALAKIR